MSTCYFPSLAAANGAKATGGAPSADTLWPDCGELAGKPHSEGVPQGLLPGAAGHTLPGCRAGKDGAAFWSRFCFA